jgi:hypothetical protein
MSLWRRNATVAGCGVAELLGRQVPNEAGRYDRMLGLPYAYVNRRFPQCKKSSVVSRSIADRLCLGGYGPGFEGHGQGQGPLRSGLARCGRLRWQERS